MDIFGLIGAGSTLSLVGLCYKMSNEKNGKYVRKEVCDLLHKENEVKVDNARLVMEDKYIALKADIVEIKNDVKQLIKNGK